MIFNEFNFLTAGMPKMRGFKPTLFDFWTILVTTSKFSVMSYNVVMIGKLVLQHKNVLSLLYFSRDLSFIILTFFSTFYFSLPAFLVATFELIVATQT